MSNINPSTLKESNQKKFSIFSYIINLSSDYLTLVYDYINLPEEDIQLSSLSEALQQILGCTRSPINQHKTHTGGKRRKWKETISRVRN